MDSNDMTTSTASNSTNSSTSSCCSKEQQQWKKQLLLAAKYGGHNELIRSLLLEQQQQQQKQGGVTTTTTTNITDMINNDIKTNMGATLLHLACDRGDYQLVQLLVNQYNANCNSTTEYGWTPLHRVIYNVRGQYMEIIKFLLQQPTIVVNSQKKDGETPLHTACYHGRTEIVQLLLSLNTKNKADVSIQDNYGFIPLHVAQNGTIAQLLIEQHQQTNDNAIVHCTNLHGCTPLYEACRYGRKDVVRVLMKHNANVNSQDNYGRTPFHCACYYGRYDIVQLLLSSHANNNNNTNAVPNINCQTTIDGSTPLMNACTGGYYNIVQLLIGQNKSKSKNKNQNNNNNCYCCHVNVQNKYGETALHRASKNGHVPIVELLVRNGANIHIKTTATFNGIQERTVQEIAPSDDVRIQIIQCIQTILQLRQYAYTWLTRRSGTEYNTILY